ncbi:MAG: hypothetical protein HYZ87_01020 [Candidatus Omnitrophica bacterium]|nr:hypothetical protein [Candidatus Omnitrophota bacterium]
MLGKRTVVRFVPSKELNRWGVREFIYPLSRASRVICEDSQAFETLLFHGIKADKAAVIEGPLEGHPNLEDYSKRLQDLL